MSDQICCGGWIKRETPCKEAIDALNAVRTELETHYNEQFETFNVINNTSQLVAGVNWHICVDIGNNRHLNVHIFHDFINGNRYTINKHELVTPVSATSTTTD